MLRAGLGKRPGIETATSGNSKCTTLEESDT